jgi:hypothetical protein
MTGHWQFFSKPAIDPVQLLESGHWRGNAKVFGFKVGCAAIPAAGAGWTYFGTRAISGRPLLHLNFVTNGHKTGNNTSFCCPLRDLA